ncbi:MAG: ABC transporter permease [Campylobacterota bacterium]|nr:ABC transporter permease [Campylobacterota bacterium]
MQTSFTNRFITLLNYLIGIILLLVAWSYLATIYPPAIIPSLGSIFDATLNIYENEVVMTEMGYTIYRVFASSVLSVVIGVTLGILCGVIEPLNKAITPLAIIFENVPPIGWMVLTIMWFGIGDIPSIVVGVISAVPIIFFYIVSAVQNINVKIFEMARDFRLTPMQVLTSIYIPSIMPSIAASLSTGIGLSWRVVVMAEALSAYDGIGQKLWGNYMYGDTPAVYSYIFIIALLGLAMEYLVAHPIKSKIEKRYMKNVNKNRKS